MHDEFALMKKRENMNQVLEALLAEEGDDYRCAVYGVAKLSLRTGENKWTPEKIASRIDTCLANHLQDLDNDVVLKHRALRQSLIGESSDEMFWPMMYNSLLFPDYLNIAKSTNELATDLISKEESFERMYIFALYWSDIYNDSQVLVIDVQKGLTRQLTTGLRASPQAFRGARTHTRSGVF